MADYTLRPDRLLKGAFIEYGLSLPPLAFVFQFNPETLSRGRTASYTPAGADGSGGAGCRDGSEGQQRSCLSQVQVSEETISLTLQLDATDDLDDGAALPGQFGIGPQLSNLELMIYPKTDQLFGFPIGNLIGASDQFGAAQAKTLPILLFVWGRKRVMPVVMTSMQITEQEFFPDLNPKRASVAVQLKVLEGFNPPYLYSHGWRIAQGAMNLANIGDLLNVFEGSRYLKVADITVTEADGSTRTIKAAREPLPVSGAMNYRVREGDRLDLLAQRFYRNPRKWWLIADANPQLLWLDELLQVGEVIVIPRDRAVDGGL